MSNSASNAQVLPNDSNQNQVNVQVGPQAAPNEENRANQNRQNKGLIPKILDATVHFVKLLIYLILFCLAARFENAEVFKKLGTAAIGLVSSAAEKIFKIWLTDTTLMLVAFVCARTIEGLMILVWATATSEGADYKTYMSMGVTAAISFGLETINLIVKLCYSRWQRS